MPAASIRVLTQFFKEHLHFTPTPDLVDLFAADLALVSPHLMHDALKEVAASLKGQHVSEYREIIFGVYNRKVAEHAQLFPIFHSFETAFRSTVCVELERYYGQPQWWKSVYLALQRGVAPTTITSIGKRTLPKDTAHLIGEIIKHIDGEKLQRNQMSALTDGYRFTEQCKLSHIEKLIVRHWSLLGPKFSKPTRKLTHKDFQAKFSRVRDARNKVYHHQSLSGMSQVVHTAEELLDYLDFSLGFVHQKIISTPMPLLKFVVPVEPRHHIW
jgi:hypothetical protein